MRIADRLALYGAQPETLRGVVGRLFQAAVVEDQRLGLAVLQKQLAIVGAFEAALEQFGDAFTIEERESPGTTVVLAIMAPKGNGIVDIDDHGSKLEVFSDDKGTSLLEEGRVGPFPKITEDGSAALVELEVRARPSVGTSSLNVQGTIAMTPISGSYARALRFNSLIATRISSWESCPSLQCCFN